MDAIDHLLRNLYAELSGPSRALVVASTTPEAGMRYMENVTGVRFVDTSAVVYGVAGDYFVVKFILASDTTTGFGRVLSRVTDIYTRNTTFRQKQYSKFVFLTTESPNTSVLAKHMQMCGYELTPPPPVR